MPRPPAPSRNVRRAAAIALCLQSMSACGGSAQGPEAAGPSAVAPEDDLVARMPTGAEALVELDVAQLRGWPMFERLRKSLPEGATSRLAGLGNLGVDAIADVDRAVLALATAAPGLAELTAIAVGRFPASQIRRALDDKGGDAPAEDYHGATIYVGAHGAWAALGEDVAGYGSRGEVRRAVDVLRAGEPGLAVSPVPTDRALLVALHRAPTARTGLPAARGALLVGETWRERLVASGIPKERAAELQWISAALAVGDGADLGLVAGTRDAAAAARWMTLVNARLDGWRADRTLRVLGLAPFADLVKMGARDGEVHLAFRLGARNLDRFVDRVTRLEALARRVPVENKEEAAP